MEVSHCGLFPFLPALLLCTACTGASSFLQSSYGYVLNHQFAGQQGAGLLALTSLQCWVQRSNLPMKIVEPFFRNSTFYGFPRSTAGEWSLGLQARLRDLLDLEKFNSISLEQGLDSLVSWEEFVEHSPRNLIVVSLEDTRTERKPPEVIWSGDKGNGGKQECYPQLRHTLWIKQLLLHYPSFCVVKVVTLRPKSLVSRLAPFTMDELSDVIFGSWDPREVSLVFKWWCWHWDPWGAGQLGAMTEDTQPHCRALAHKLLNGKLAARPELLGYAQAFETKHAKKSPYSVAVMLRVERIIMDEQRFDTYSDDTLLSRIENCLVNASAITRELEASLGSGNTFVTADTGKFGSKTWKPQIANTSTEQKVSDMTQQTMGELLHTDLLMDQLDDLYVNVTGGMDDPGYIAALQRIIASRADCIVILGGGNFIKVALEQYLHYHPSHAGRCVHYVCVSKRFRVEYKKLMMPAGMIMIQ